jgi:hypothetical protein
MSQIALNANAVWDKHIFVKFGEVNRIPVQSASDLSTPIAEGSMVQMLGDYTVTNALTVNNPVYGIALMNDPAAQYQTGTQYPLSVLPVTLGSVISIPVDLLPADPAYATGDAPMPLYVNSTGQLVTGTNSPLNTYNPVGFVINEADGYIDFVFCSGAEFATYNQDA